MTRAQVDEARALARENAEKEQVCALSAAESLVM